MCQEQKWNKKSNKRENCKQLYTVKTWHLTQQKCGPDVNYPLVFKPVPKDFLIIMIYMTYRMKNYKSLYIYCMKPSREEKRKNKIGAPKKSGTQHWDGSKSGKPPTREQKELSCCLEVLRIHFLQEKLFLECSFLF